MRPAEEFIRHVNNCLHMMDVMIESEAAPKKGRAAVSDKSGCPGSMTLNF